MKQKHIHFCRHSLPSSTRCIVNDVRFSAALFLAFLALGCVERKLHIRTEPEGAVIAVNGTEIGTSPVTWEFFHYGTIRVTARLKGYETQQKIVKLKAPWYEYPVIDLFSDVVVPTTIHDEHHLQVALVPRESTPKEIDLKNAAALGVRATALRDTMRAQNAVDAPPESAPQEDSGE